MTDKRTTQDRIRAFCRRSGYAVGSHMHNGLFLVSRPVAPDVREWRVAKYDGKNKGVTIGDHTAPIKSGAATMLQLALASKGISPNVDPTASLKGVISYPVNATD